MSAAATIQEVCATVREGGRILPVGGGTKSGLSGIADPAVSKLYLSPLCGITEYEPGELTLTALAGTPIAEIDSALAENGQYLPFDPPLAASGATLGGTVAAGLSGPGAWRYGSLRDFVIGVRLIDGTGTLVSGGGKVVKNAAGFDLSKMMVGSLGTLGVLVEVSLKVFPRAVSTTSLAFEFPDLEGAIAAIVRIGRGPIGAEAVELIPPGRVVVRLGGDPGILPRLSERLQQLVGAEAQGDIDEEGFWREAAQFAWPGSDRLLIRAAVSLGKVAELEQILAGVDARARYSNGANVAWIDWAPERPLAELDAALAAAGIPAMTVLGPSTHRLIGARPGGAFADRVRAAMDPDSRFLEV